MRLIDADALILKSFKVIIPNEYKSSWVVLEKDIRCAPMIGLSGEWIQSIKQGKFSCSICKKWSNDKYNYCPNCGAKMSEGV